MSAKLFVFIALSLYILCCHSNRLCYSSCPSIFWPVWALTLKTKIDANVPHIRSDQCNNIHFRSNVWIAQI